MKKPLYICAVDISSTFDPTLSSYISTFEEWGKPIHLCLFLAMVSKFFYTCPRQKYL